MNGVHMNSVHNNRVHNNRPAPSLVARAGTATALTLAVVGASVLVPGAASGAQAATHATKALNVAASKRGAPYKYGASGPHRFDCSGLTLYSYKRVGKSLPRTAQAQYNKTRHIRSSQRQRGDLVFFHRGRSVYHVGIYAGGDKIWHSPKRGEVVRLQRIWSKSVWYGRVR
jgi:cell wall-associated NlpC family hydrolase